MNRQIHSIQYLRAIAALMVLLFHANSINLYANKKQILELGNYGVDIFFFISGFIMAHVMIREDHEEFFRKRIARIYPPYFWALLVCLVISSFGIGGVADEFFFDFTLFKFYDDNPPRVHHLPVAWSLYYEMFFYLVCAICLWLFQDHKEGMNWFFALLLLSSNFIKTTSLEPEFFFILLSGFYFYQLRKGFNSFDLVYFGLCLTKVYYLFEDGPIRVLCVILSMFFIMFFDKVKISEIKPLTLIGNASYSIYLLHISLLFSINKFLPADLFLRDLFFVFYAIIVIGLCVANYWFVERNFISKLTVSNKLRLSSI